MSCPELLPDRLQIPFPGGGKQAKLLLHTPNLVQFFHAQLAAGDDTEIKSCLRLGLATEDHR